MTDAELEALVALGEGITPGPWVVNPFVAQVDCEAISAKGGLLPVCQMLWPTDERGEDETEANARAIAAVPDLIAALTTLRKQRDELREALVAHNDGLRTAFQVADREGQVTNWTALRSHLRVVLASYHEITNEARATQYRARQALSNMEGE